MVNEAKETNLQSHRSMGRQVALHRAREKEGEMTEKGLRSEFQAGGKTQLLSEEEKESGRGRGSAS